jgi:hypothetical protein
LPNAFSHPVEYSVVAPFLITLIQTPQQKTYESIIELSLR